MVNSVEIFSGAGGLAKGMELAGFCHKAFVEWNADACRTLRANFPPEIVHEGDIRNVNFRDFENVDLIAGGPPCQPFSLGGKAKGNEDERDMFPAAIRAIRELRPKVFVFENVKGLLRNSFKDYFNYIILQLQFPGIKQGNLTWREHYAKILEKSKHAPGTGLMYDVSYTLINAADYGIPQKRERVIIVGIRKDLNVNWVFPVTTHSQASLLWSKYVTHEYWESLNISPSNEEYSGFKQLAESLKLKWGLFPPTLKPWRTVRNALANMPGNDSEIFFPDEHIAKAGAREYFGHTGSPIDEPSKTIKAGNHGVPGGENMVRLPDGTVRYYTIFEAKRIQTFPDSYHITGSWTEAMRQIGNAVPVQLANIIASSLKDSVFK